MLESAREDEDGAFVSENNTNYNQVLVMNQSSISGRRGDEHTMIQFDVEEEERNRHALLRPFDNCPMVKKPSYRAEDSIMWDDKDLSVFGGAPRSAKLRSTQAAIATLPQIQTKLLLSSGDIGKYAKSLSRIDRQDSRAVFDSGAIEPRKTMNNNERSGCIGKDSPLEVGNDRFKNRPLPQKTKLSKETQLRFQISLYVKKFLVKLQKRSAAFMFRNAKGNPFQVYADPTYSYEDYQKQVEKSQGKGDDSNMKFLFDMVSFFVILFNIIYIPIKLAFNDYYGIFESVYPERATLGFLAAEIMMNMSTQFYIRAEIVTDRVSVFKQYLEVRVWSDIIVALPYLIGVLLPDDYGWLMLSFLLRFLDFINILNVLEKKMKTQNQISDSLRCILLIFFVAHLSACSIFSISRLPKSSSERSYLDLADVDKTIWFQVYCYSFYWSIITMTTIGYGDIRPASHRERVYAVFFAVLSCVVFGFTLNQIGSIMSNLYKKAVELRQRQVIMDKFMKKRKLSPQLQIKVRKNLEYAQKNNKEEEQRIVEGVMGCLTQSLRNQLSLELYADVISNVKAFKHNFSKAFVSELALCFKEYVVTQEDQLYAENDTPNKLFYIIRGEVELFINGRKCPTTVGKNEILGLEEFFTQRAREVEAKTSRVTTIAVVTYDDFLNVLHNHQSDFETYKMILDSWNLYGNSSRMSLKCQNCKEFFHSISKCPYLSYNIDRGLVIQKHTYGLHIPPPLPRSTAQKKMSAFLIQPKVWEAVYKIFQNYLEFADFLDGEHMSSGGYLNDQDEFVEDGDEDDDDEDDDGADKDDDDENNSENGTDYPIEDQEEPATHSERKGNQLSERQYIAQDSLGRGLDTPSSYASGAAGHQSRKHKKAGDHFRRRKSASPSPVPEGEGDKFVFPQAGNGATGPANGQPVNMMQSQNQFFQTLQKELRRNGQEELNLAAIEKNNPLLQRFFGGQNRSDSAMDIMKGLPTSNVSISLQGGAAADGFGDIHLSKKQSSNAEAGFSEKFFDTHRKSQNLLTASSQEPNLQQAHTFSFNSGGNNNSNTNNQLESQSPSHSQRMRKSELKMVPIRQLESIADLNEEGDVADSNRNLIHKNADHFLEKQDSLTNQLHEQKELHHVTFQGKKNYFKEEDMLFSTPLMHGHGTTAATAGFQKVGTTTEHWQGSSIISALRPGAAEERTNEINEFNLPSSMLGQNEALLLSDVLHENKMFDQISPIRPNNRAGGSPGTIDDKANHNGQHNANYQASYQSNQNNPYTASPSRRGKQISVSVTSNNLTNYPIQFNLKEQAESQFDLQIDEQQQQLQTQQQQHQTFSQVNLLANRKKQQGNMLNPPPNEYEYASGSDIQNHTDVNSVSIKLDSSETGGYLHQQIPQFVSMKPNKAHDKSHIRSNSGQSPKQRRSRDRQASTDVNICPDVPVQLISHNSKSGQKGTFRTFCKAKMQNEQNDQKKQLIAALIDRTAKSNINTGTSRFNSQQRIQLEGTEVATINSSSNNNNNQNFFQRAKARESSTRVSQRAFSQQMINKEKLSQSFDLNEIATNLSQPKLHKNNVSAKFNKIGIVGVGAINGAGPVNMASHPHSKGFSHAVENVYEKQLNINKRIVDQNFGKVEYFPMQQFFDSMGNGSLNMSPVPLTKVHSTNSSYEISATRKRKLQEQQMQRQSMKRISFKLQDRSPSSRKSTWKQQQQQQLINISTNGFGSATTVAPQQTSSPLIYFPTEENMSMNQTAKEDEEEPPFFVVADFDIMKTFKVYFPQNNIAKVLKSYVAYKKKKLSAGASPYRLEKSQRHIYTKNKILY